MLTFIGDRLFRNENLGLGKYLISPNKEFKLVMREDGNLVIYCLLDENRIKWQSKALWPFRNSEPSPEGLQFEEDGNLVIYDKKKRVKWQTNTGGTYADLFRIQNDGNVVLYKNDKTTDGQIIWSPNVHERQCR